MVKYIIVGSSHVGYEAAETILEAEENAEIHMFERGGRASFMGWGSQSYLEGISESLDELHYANEESYKKQGIKLHLNSDVVGVDKENKSVIVETEEGERKESYDKLILSPGGFAPKLNIPGKDLDHVYTFRGPEDTEAVNKRMKEAKKVVVIGGGYIGIEVADAYVKNGLDVTLINRSDRFLSGYMDEEFYDVLDKEAEKNGLNVVTNESAKEIKGEDGKIKSVVTDKGEYEADTVIMAVGVKPGTSWLEGVVELDDKGFVVVNDYLETSLEDVYGGGDATLIPFNPTGKKASIGIATNARRQGVIAAKNATGERIKMHGVNGTSGLKFFDLKFAITGLDDTNLDDYDGEVKSYYTEERLRPSFMRDGGILVRMKIFYDAETEVILGGQFLSTEDITEAANIISIAISAKMTLSDLAKADFFFQPEYSRPWHFLNVLALKARGKTYGSTEMLF